MSYLITRDGNKYLGTHGLWTRLKAQARVFETRADANIVAVRLGARAVVAEVVR